MKNSILLALAATATALTLAGCRSNAPTAPTAPRTVEKAQPEISVASIATAATQTPAVQTPAVQTPVASATPSATGAMAPAAAPAVEPTAAASFYRVRGQVVQLPAPGGVLIVVKHENIPGFMPAMQMRMALRDAADARKLKAGDKIAFDLSKGDTQISNIAVLPPATPLQLAP